jgi:hypothetical protein
MKKRWFVLSIVIIVLAIAFSSWYFFLSYENCEDIDCFNRNLIECSRARYTNQAEWVYEYFIKGEKNGECVVDAKLVFAGAEPKFESLIEKKMRCFMPLKMVDLPEDNMEYCTGPLKEDMQYLVIKDLYQYVAQNLGK